jgi:hypothetical protein
MVRLGVRKGGRAVRCCAVTGRADVCETRSRAGWAVAVGRGRGQTASERVVQRRWRDRGYVLIGGRAIVLTDTDETRGSSERFRSRSQWCWVILGEARGGVCGCDGARESRLFVFQDGGCASLNSQLSLGESLAGKGSRRGLSVRLRSGSGTS